MLKTICHQLCENQSKLFVLSIYSQLVYQIVPIVPIVCMINVFLYLQVLVKLNLNLNRYVILIYLFGFMCLVNFCNLLLYGLLHTHCAKNVMFKCECTIYAHRAKLLYLHFIFRVVFVIIIEAKNDIILDVIT